MCTRMALFGKRYVTMATTIFMITARAPVPCNDGRNPAVFWGQESQYHAVRETAVAACQRLQEGGAHSCDPIPEYGVAELSRVDFPSDDFGAEEWYRACRVAGVDAEAAGASVAPVE
jgi:hypothetical protein